METKAPGHRDVFQDTWLIHNGLRELFPVGVFIQWHGPSGCVLGFRGPGHWVRRSRKPCCASGGLSDPAVE